MKQRKPYIPPQTGITELGHSYGVLEERWSVHTGKMGNPVMGTSVMGTVDAEDELAKPQTFRYKSKLWDDDEDEDDW